MNDEHLKTKYLLVNKRTFEAYRDYKKCLEEKQNLFSELVFRGLEEIDDEDDLKGIKELLE